MKVILALILIVLSASTFAQTTTYSIEEEKMVQYVNNGIAYAMKYDSLQK